MTKLAAIWYPRSLSCAGRNEVIDVVSDNNIKSLIDTYLFDKNANTILINYKDKLYLVESTATNNENRLYTRRSIEYHPLSSLVN